MTPAQMPENVGKRIVEALKKRGLSKPVENSEEDFVTESNIGDETINTYETINTEEPETPVEVYNDIEETNDFTETEEVTGSFTGDESFEAELTEAPDENAVVDVELSNDNIEEIISEEEPEVVENIPEENVSVENEPDFEEYIDNSDDDESDDGIGLNNNDIPANVAILNKLISDLPGDVSKQTGALIIRNTMEALGISLDNVISEAQGVQDTLTEQTASDKQKIEEHKLMIAELEKNVRDYKIQSEKLNELISLFVITE